MNIQASRGKTANGRSKPAMPEYLKGFDTLQGEHGNYKIVDSIDNGGMGAILMAYYESAYPVAIKVAFDGQDGALIGEYNALSKIDHPNVVKAIDIGEVNGRTFIALELLSGQNLHSFLCGGMLDADTAVSLMMSAVEGIEAVHEARLLHLDLKPANIFLDMTDGVKIIDFGLAREFTNEPEAPFGTPGFMAPERAKGATADQRSDIYSLGAVLYEMLTGTSLFIGSESEILSKTIHDSPIDIGAFRLNIPEVLEATISRALDKNPERRFRSAIAFREALECSLDAIRVEHSGVRPRPDIQSDVI